MSDDRDDDDFEDAEIGDEDKGEKPGESTIDDGAIELEPFVTRGESLLEQKPQKRPGKRGGPGGDTTKAAAARAAHSTTTAERQLRVATVATMIINGFRRHDIHAYVNEKLREQWNGLSERGIDRLIASAKVIIEREAAVDFNLEKGKATARLDTLYRMALNAKLYGTALRVQTRINRLHGLDAPVKLKHGMDPENPLPPGTTNFIVVVQEVEEA